MTKTVNYNLKKPEPTDPLRVEDFNENADIIDDALATLNVDHVHVGSFAGTGVDKSTIHLGFTPRAIILMTQTGDDGKASFNFATADFGYYINNGFLGLIGTRCVEGGIYVASALNNSKAYSNNFIAFI